VIKAGRKKGNLVIDDIFGHWEAGSKLLADLLQTGRQGTPAPFYAALPASGAEKNSINSGEEF